MSNYRRAFISGGAWFFTVNLLPRYDNDLPIREIGLLREAMKRVRIRHPFQIDARVVLPEHLHCFWTLPPGDADFSNSKQVSIREGMCISGSGYGHMTKAERILGGTHD